MTEHRLAQKELATALHNNLRKRFFEVSKLDSKQLFLAVQRGESIPFLEVVMPEQGQLRFDLQLDYSLFEGRLNFSRFRRALDAHLARLARAIESEQALNVYTAGKDSDFVLNHPGAIDDDGQLNFMLTRIHQLSAGRAILQLFFVDPSVIERDG